MDDFSFSVFLSNIQLNTLEVTEEYVNSLCNQLTAQQYAKVFTTLQSNAVNTETAKHIIKLLRILSTPNTARRYHG